MKRLFIFLSFILITNLYSQPKLIHDFKLETISGEKISLYELLKSGPVYINFWAMWCVPCRAELKALQQIYDEFKFRGVNVISINIDSPRSTSKVKSFIAGQKYAFPVLLDPNQEVFKKLNGYNLPYSLLIDRDGKLVKVRNSYLPGDEKEIKKDIETLLK
jgi:cytochrome c biogenesis protein CcmG/thiol:disulfide interchange protein DsbE